MHTIEVDFDVLKQLMLRRDTEEVTYNDVIRNLLGMEQRQQNSLDQVETSPSDDWITKGARFPAGTEFRASYKGDVHRGRIENGTFMVNGERFGSLSAAAVSITGSPVNGWRFWECKLPGKEWKLTESHRRKS